MEIRLDFRRKRQVFVLAEMLVFGPFLLAWVPGWGKFALDLVWVLLGLLAGRSRVFGGRSGAEGLALWVLSGLAVFAAVYLITYQSGLYFLWGLRNNFRFYGAFFGFALLTNQERERIWKGLEGVFWLHFFLSLGQFFGFGLKGDFLGGLFGWEKGCNGAVNLFFLVMITRSLVFAMEGRETGISCLAKCGAALLVAALAELKFFFVEFALCLLLASLCCGRGKLWVKAGAVAALLGGVWLMYRCFPEFAGWLTPGKIFKTAGSKAGYASTGDLNRLNAISEIDRRVFTSGWQRVFGLGLGNCEASAVSFLATSFYKWYGHLHYTWMSHAFWYLEGGWLGLVFFFGFFLLVASGKWEGAEGKTVRILAVMCLLVGVYNASLRTEAAFLMYFALSGGDRTEDLGMSGGTVY